MGFGQLKNTFIKRDGEEQTEYGVVWVESWGGSRMNWGRGKHDQHILYEHFN